ncbi:class I SAM-dependent methyltransferase [Frischella sp. Ac48]|uniref:Ribosomal RNA small subunit methyltransferase J n=1 Tax=Frischella japonica TaxID=2741544 RepID=A0ABR7QVM4_9GAMM|nr:MULTISPECIES: class I SAM-dependent methyltransferase [Frischella]MBC9130282.1 class I SAM-dependent methyltransferase [Frischella japonica]MBX4133271.1 class I SAM-dependent methyltransferase [Frischella sp. Ac48]
MNLFEQANHWLAEHQLDKIFKLSNDNGYLTLFKIDEPKLGGIFVDFIGGASAHRRRYGGGRGEAIAKAVGIKGDYLPTVLDATAGLGRDAFVLAAIGCHVTMFERHPVVVALLDDGLKRAYLDHEIGERLQQLLTLFHNNILNSLTNMPEKVDVVYLDPMFPHRQKTALVKKEMRVFQHLVGSDNDADGLLSLARHIAKKRVVVKRPDYADYLDKQKPVSSIKTKSHRFDIYAPIVND